MGSSSETDDTTANTIQRAVKPLVSALSRAVFGVCAVVVGTLVLLLAAGESTAEFSLVFGLLGVAALIVGFVTISRLPTPQTESSSTESPTQMESTPDEHGSTDGDSVESTGNDTDSERTE